MSTFLWASEAETIQMTVPTISSLRALEKDSGKVNGLGELNYRDADFSIPFYFYFILFSKIKTSHSHPAKFLIQETR